MAFNPKITTATKSRHCCNNHGNDKQYSSFSPLMTISTGCSLTFVVGWHVVALVLVILSFNTSRDKVGSCCNVASGFKKNGGIISTAVSILRKVLKTARKIMINTTTTTNYEKKKLRHLTLLILHWTIR